MKMKTKKLIARMLTFVILSSMILVASLPVSAADRQTLFGDSYNAFLDGRWGTYNLGTEFETNADGYITALRGYIMEGEVGIHFMCLYANIPDGGDFSNAGWYDLEVEAAVAAASLKRLAQVEFETDGKQGWVELPLAAPVAISKGTYVVTLSTGESLPTDEYEEGGNIFARLTGDDALEQQNRPAGGANVTHVQGRYIAWDDRDADDIPFPINPWGTNLTGADIVFTAALETAGGTETAIEAAPVEETPVAAVSFLDILKAELEQTS